MNVSVENGDGCRRILSIKVPAEDTRADYDSIVKVFAGNAKIPGFRPGRAPLALVEKRYAKGIMQETRERLLPRFYNKALEQEGITPVAIADVQDVDFSRDGGLSFKVLVDIAPEFKLPKYKKIALKREPVKITDEEVDSTLNNILERFSRFEDVEDKPAASGDMVQADYSAVCDGKPLADIAGDLGGLAAGEDFWIPLLDENEFVPGMNAALSGASVGDEITVDVEFPADYQHKAVAGLKAVYTVKVKKIRAKVQPELTEEFLKQFNVSSETELRERIRQDLEEAAVARENGRLKNEISRILVEKAKLDVPQALVERETYSLVQETLERVSKGGASSDMIKEHHEEILKSASETALHRVKLSYIVNAICKEEGIEVTDDDIENQLAVIGQRYGMNAEQVRAELEKQDEGLNNLKMDILGNKVMDFLLENAKIKE